MNDEALKRRLEKYSSMLINQYMYDMEQDSIFTNEQQKNDIARYFVSFADDFTNNENLIRIIDTNTLFD
jgi:hypothetical protein